MKTFSLRIGTPEGMAFQGEAERVLCRSMVGDLAILAGHSNYCTALGMGEAAVVMKDGTRRTAACIGGMLTVMNGVCRLLANSWEWKEEIDVARAEDAKKRAEEKLSKAASEEEKMIAAAELRRAEVRLGVAGK